MTSDGIEPAGSAAGPLDSSLPPAAVTTGRSHYNSAAPHTVPATMRRFGLLTVLTYFGVAICIGGALLQLWIMDRFLELINQYGWGHVPRAEIPDGTLVDTLTYLFNFGGFVLAGAAFFLAMARARRMAEAAGVSGFDYGFGWTVGSIFVPVISLYRPWVGLGEIRRAVFDSVRGGRTGTAWKEQSSSSGATVALAIVYIGGNILLLLVTRGISQNPGHDQAAFIAWSTLNIGLFAAIAIIKLITYGALGLYLSTLAPKLRQVIALGYSHVFD